MNAIQQIVQAAKGMKQAERVEICHLVLATLDLQHKLQAEAAIKRQIAADQLRQQLGVKENS